MSSSRPRKRPWARDDHVDNRRACGWRGGERQGAGANHHHRLTSTWASRRCQLSCVPTGYRTRELFVSWVVCAPCVRRAVYISNSICLRTPARQPRAQHARAPAARRGPAARGAPARIFRSYAIR